MKYITDVYGSYFDIYSQSNRKEFLIFIIFIVLASGLLFFIDIRIGTVYQELIIYPDGYERLIIIPYLTAIFIVLSLIPMISLYIRRLRDADFSPWLGLLLVVPVGNLVVFLLCCFPTRKQSV